MGNYVTLRQKLLDQGVITPEEAKAFFVDLFEISKKRIYEETGNDFASYFPTKQYRGPGGMREEVNGWKYQQPLGVCDHFTASDSHRSALKWFSSYAKWNKGGGIVGPSSASACFVVALSGEPFLLIDFWNGKADWHEPALNGLALGIEHVNCGELRQKDGKFYWWASNWGSQYPYTDTLPPQAVKFRGCSWMQPFTKAQILTNLIIKRALVCLYKTPGTMLRPELFVDHAMYRDDKTDQGPLWPLDALRDASFAQDPLNTYGFYEDAVKESQSVYASVDSLDVHAVHRDIIRADVMPVNLESSVTDQSGILSIQLGLRALGYATPIGGTYNDAYVAALKKFQTDNGLTSDGILGPVTRSALKAKLSGKGKT